MSKKKSPSKSGKKSPQRPAAPAAHGPQRFGAKSWQTGKPHPTPIQLAGKSRKVH